MRRFAIAAPSTLAWVAGAAFGGAMVALAFRASTEIVDAGRLLPDVDQRVYELRVLGAFTAHVAPQTRGAGFVEVQAMDLFTGLVLVWVAGAAFLAAATLEAAGRERNARPWRLHLLLAGGATWLALDELLSLHESIGFNLPSLDRPVEVHASTGPLVLYLAWRPPSDGATGTSSWAAARRPWRSRSPGRRSELRSPPICSTTARRSCSSSAPPWRWREESG